MFDVSLLNLPWATLVTLTSGYIGYFIANVGLKDHHKPIEVTFSSLIFGLTAMMAYQAVMWAGLNAWLATPQHFCVPLHAVRGGAGTVANGCTDYCGIMIFHGLTIPAQHGRQCLIKQASASPRSE